MDPLKCTQTASTECHCLPPSGRERNAVGQYSRDQSQHSQRLPEIAIRIALGADNRRVVALVVRDGLAIVVTGLVIGFVISLFGIRLIRRLPFHVAANDWTTFVLACVLIALMAAGAFLIPSRRALRTDPAGVFRGA